MLSALSIAVTGLNDAALRVANATSNIVNASSTIKDGKNYQGTSVVSSANATSGVNSQIVPRTGNDGIDLAAELIDMTTASYTYQANAKNIKVVSENQQRLLDTIA